MSLGNAGRSAEAQRVDHLADTQALGIAGGGAVRENQQLIAGRRNLDAKIGQFTLQNEYFLVLARPLLTTAFVVFAENNLDYASCQPHPIKRSDVSIS
jgi:hypothetical protein